MILRKPYDFQRSFLQQVFGGKDLEGRRYGVYAKYDEEKSQIVFELYGLVISEEITLPLDQDILKDGPGDHTGYQKKEVIDEPNEKDGTSLSSKQQIYPTKEEGALLRHPPS